MKHWFVRWMLLTWAVHFIAQTTFISCIVWYFGYSDSVNGFLAEHRPLAAFFLVVHFTTYLLTEITSSSQHKLESVERESLEDD